MKIQHEIAARANNIFFMVEVLGVEKDGWRDAEPERTTEELLLQNFGLVQRFSFGIGNQQVINSGGEILQIQLLIN